MRSLFIDQFLAASHFSRSWICPTVLRGSSLLQDISVVRNYAFHFCRHKTSSIITDTVSRPPNNLAFTSDSLHGTRHTTLVRLIRTFYDVNTHAAANFYNHPGDVMPSSNLHFTTGSAPTLTGFSVPFRLRSNSPFPRFGSRRVSGNTCCVRI